MIGDGNEVTAEKEAAAAATAKQWWSALIVAGGTVASVLGGLGLMELQSPRPQPLSAAPPAAVEPAVVTRAEPAATPRQPARMCGGWIRLSGAQKIVATAENLGKLAELEDRPWDNVCLVQNLPRLVAWMDSVCEPDGLGATDEVYALSLQGRAHDFCGQR